jgi:hypothetical protein
MTTWNTEPIGVRNVMCIGDSITLGTADLPLHSKGIREGWVDQIARALDRATGPRPGDGYRGTWRVTEWTREGTWTRTQPSDPFDVAPFGQGHYSPGAEVDTFTWSKPAALTVAAFDLYWFDMPGIGNWQFRIDEGEWVNIGAAPAERDRRLLVRHVAQAVHERVEIRASDGRAPCVATIAGIGIYAIEPQPAAGTIVHNLGFHQLQLDRFCRASAGDPYALIDDLRPAAVTVMFSNDVLLRKPDRFDTQLRALVERARRYADVLIMSPYEQRGPRQVHDAAVTAGSTALRSEAAAFVDSDAGWAIGGPGIDEKCTIAAVVSATEVKLSRPAAVTATRADVTIGRGREVEMQAEYSSDAKRVAESTGCGYLDLCAEWAKSTGGGWDAAYAYGLMNDRMHTTQRGYDDIAERVAAWFGLEVPA